MGVDSRLYEEINMKETSAGRSENNRSRMPIGNEARIALLSRVSWARSLRVTGKACQSQNA